MSQEILIKNIPLTFLKEKDSKFFDSVEFSDFESLFDKFKTKVDLSPVIVEDYEILPITELKLCLRDKYLGIERIIESEEQKNDMIFIQLSGKKESSLNFKQKKYITNSMSELQKSKHFFVSIFLNNIFLNAFNKGFSESKKNSVNNTISELLIKPTLTTNVSKDIANISNFFDRIKDPLVYNNIEYDTFLKYSNIKNNINTNALASPFSLIQTKIGELENYNANNLAERSKNLKYKLLTKYYDQQYSFPVDTELTLEDDFPALDILNSFMTIKNKEYILEINRNIVLNSTSFTVNHNLGHSFFKILMYDTSDGSLLSNELITEQVSDITNNTTTFTFNTNLNVELLIISDNYEPVRILTTTLFQYYQLSNFNDNILTFSSIIENEKISIDINNFNKGFGLIEIYSTFEEKILIPSSITFTDETIELDFSGKIGRFPINVYILPTHRVVSNISKIRLTCENIFDFLKNQSPFDSSLKAWREFNND